MIKDTSEHNETVKPNDFEMERLRAALPEYFDGDGNFMIDRLQQALQDGDVDLTREGYELKFLGKSYAKYLTSTKTETVVVPDLEHNSKPENKDSENLYIVGDNLDALKHLLGSYAGKVKCIYIDPPYNTGSDGFVYNDDFGFTPAQLVDKIGLSEDEAERVLDLQGKSSHSAWLTFMYPRLQLAKELLTADGVIFISIDDNEQSNLRLLCDEVFGEQNLIGQIIWKTATDNNKTQIATEHEYITCYAKNRAEQSSWVAPNARAQMILKKYQELKADSHDDVKQIQRELRGWMRRLKRELSGVSHYDRVDDRGVYYPGNSANTKPGDYTFDIVHPVTGKVCAKPENGYRWPESTFLEAAKRGDVEWGETERNVPKIKKRLETVTDTLSSVYYEDNRGMTKNLEAMMGSRVFENPKSVNLIRRLILFVCQEDSLVLDFFSGSATTADAVMRSNAADDFARRYIMVQLPEEISEKAPAYPNGYRTIDQIGRERIKRAAVKIREETGADIDYGFRLYRLEEPSGQVLDQLERFDPEDADTLFSGDYVSKFDLNGTPGHDTVLATWLVEDGHGLTTGAQQVTLAGYELDVCGDSAYIISPGLTSDDLVELVRQLENGDLAVSRVVVFGYSVTFGVMHELKKNLSVLKSGRTVSVIERL